MTGIYKITSPSGRIYVGQSRDLSKRKRHYTPGRCKNQRMINNSLRKYGHKSHIFDIIQVFPEDVEQIVLDNYEIFYYEQFKEGGFKMLNLKKCGNGGGKHSAETRRIIGEQSKKRFKAKKGYEIYQYDKDLKLVKIWKESILDIAKINSFHSSPGLTRAIHSNEKGSFKMAYNYFWFYKKDIQYIKIIDKNRIVDKRNQFGNYLKYKHH